MRNVIIAALMPFILVWAAWLLTGFVFSTQDVFTHGAFWFIAGCYWFIIVPVVGMFEEQKGGAR